MTETEIRSASAWTHGYAIAYSGDPGHQKIVAWSGHGIRHANLRPLDDRPAEWLHEAAERLGWLISASGTAFSPQALAAVSALLVDPIFQGTPRPLIGPTDEGGISVEFRTNSVELQLETDPLGHFTAYAWRQGDAEWEGSLEELPDGIEKWAWRLGQAD